MLLGEFVQFYYHSVNLVVESFLFVFPTVADADDLVDVFCLFDVWIYGQAELFKLLQRFVVLG